MHLRARAVGRLGLLAAVAAAAIGCAGPGASRYERKHAQASLARLEAPGLVLGEFTLTKVVDGDTIKVDGLDSSLRLLGMDTEETFKTEADRRGAEAGWESYLRAKRGTHRHPVKIASPLGEQAKHWGQAFFEGVRVVRLERDDATEIRDRYDRYLAYVFAEKDGVWLNYNVEAVRAGMSPYFPKYGRSKRFHDEFVAAEREARAAQRGIWDPTQLHADDYDERKAWWDARGDFVAAFERAAEGRSDHLVVTRWDLARQLEARLGQQVTLLGTVGDVILGDRGPTRVMLSRRPGSDVPLIFFDKDVFAATGLAQWTGEFVTATGVVTEYVNKFNQRRQLQLVIDSPSQITLSPVPGLEPPAPVVVPVVDADG
ncbi:MAG: thermonuclease family protein [Kofleriaceae bacterium]